MISFMAAFWAESLKILKSKIFWIIILVFIVFPLMPGFYMFVLKNPGLFDTGGMLSRISGFAEKASWSKYFSMVTQAVPGGIGGVGFGLITCWVFGQEFSNHTAKDILALPISRATIVLAKYAVLTIWSIFLSVVLLVTMLMIGNVLQLEGWSDAIFANAVRTFVETSLLTILLSPPVGFLASVGRGYLAPMGFVASAFAIASFAGNLGFGPYFPWAIPALFSGAAGPEAALLAPVSYMILFMACILGLLGTMAWWRYADHVH
ncbi:MAG TPA: ABC transporter permease [Anaerovoracaceae bacterium]|nr:ABC transporter permease [Anaerovoracaceae bacterium]